MKRVNQYIHFSNVEYHSLQNYLNFITADRRVKNDTVVYCKVKYKDKKYFFCTDGYLYPYKGHGATRKLLKEQRINVWEL